MINNGFVSQNIMDSSNDQIGSDYWVAKKLFSETGRIGMISITDGTYGYFGLGRDENDVFHNDWYRYDPSTNTITELPPLPGDGRSFASACLNNSGKIIISGGYSHIISDCTTLPSNKVAISTTEHPRWNENATYYGTDNFGFNAIPGGNRSDDGSFINSGISGLWWSTTQSTSDWGRAWSRGIIYNNGYIARPNYDRALGLSVRCVKDYTGSQPNGTIISNDYTDGDGNTYDAVVIGEQMWTVENLYTTKYQDGTPIHHKTDNTEWINLTVGAYCWYDNNYYQAGVRFGALYNHYGIYKLVDNNGYRVPSDTDWTKLTDYLIDTNWCNDVEVTSNNVAQFLKSTRQVNHPLDGQPVNTSNPSSINYYSDAYYYNISTNTWSSSYPLEIPLAYHYSWITKDDKYYIFGGYNENGTNITLYTGDYTSWAGWSSSSLNIPFAGSNLIIKNDDNDNFYTLSGFGTPGSPVQTSYIFENNMSKINITSSPNSRQSASHLINNKIFSSLSNYPLDKKMNIYDINEDKWTYDPDYNYPESTKTFTSYFTLNDKGYVIGGGKTLSNSTALGGNTPIDNLKFYPIWIWEFNPPIITLETITASDSNETKILNSGGQNITDYEHVTSYGIEYKRITSINWILGYQVNSSLTNDSFNVSGFPSKNLIPNTSYNYRAFVKVKDTKYYGNIKTIKTKSDNSYWIPKKELTISNRVGMVGIGIGNYGYFGLGRDENDVFHNDWYKYDPSTNTITDLSSFPGNGRSSSCIAKYNYDGNDYIIIGLGTGKVRQRSIRKIKIEYTIEPYNDSGSESIGDIIGDDGDSGSSTIGDTTPVTSKIDYLSDFYQYNVNTNVWTKLNITTSRKISYANMAVFKTNNILELTIWNGEYKEGDIISNNNFIYKKQLANGKFDGYFSIFNNISNIKISSSIVDINLNDSYLRYIGFSDTYDTKSSINNIGNIEKNFITAIETQGGQSSMFSTSNGYVYSTLTNLKNLQESKDTYRYDKYNNVWELVNKYEYPSDKKSYCAYFTIGNFGYTVGGGRLKIKTYDVSKTPIDNIEFDQNYIWEFRPDDDVLIPPPPPITDNPLPSGVWGFNGQINKVIKVPQTMFNRDDLLLFVGSFTSYITPSNRLRNTMGAVILDSNYNVYKEFYFRNNNYSPYRPVINSAVIYNNYIYFGGEFDNYGKVKYDSLVRLARYNVNNNTWKTYNYNKLDGAVLDLDSQDNYLHVTGVFKNWGQDYNGYVILDMNNNDTQILVRQIWDSHPLFKDPITITYKVKCFKLNGINYSSIIKRIWYRNSFLNWNQCDKLFILEQNGNEYRKLSTNFHETLWDNILFDASNSIYNISEIKNNCLYVVTRESRHSIIKINVSNINSVSIDNNFRVSISGNDYISVSLLNDNNILINSKFDKFYSKGINDQSLTLKLDNYNSNTTLKINTFGDNISNIDTIFNIITDNNVINSSNMHYRCSVLELDDKSIYYGVGFRHEESPTSSPYRNFTTLNTDTGGINI